MKVKKKKKDKEVGEVRGVDRWKRRSWRFILIFVIGFGCGCVGWWWIFWFDDDDMDDGMFFFLYSFFLFIDGEWVWRDFFLAGWWMNVNGDCLLFFLCSVDDEV